MKQIQIFSIAVCTLILLSGCILDDVFDCEYGRGDIVEEEFSLDRFDDVRLGVDADVFITQGDDHFARVSAQNNILDELEFKVRNRTLFIQNDKCLRDYENIEIHLIMRDIEHLSVSGSGNIVGENAFEVGDIDLELSGSGGIDVEVTADDIEASISGSGDMALVGQANTLDFRVSGSGDLSAFALEVQRADIRISGSGDAEVFVTDILDVRISGSGDVLYKGDPDIDSRISGSGRIIDAN